MRAERDRLDLIIDSVADPILVDRTRPACLVLMNAPAEPAVRGARRARRRSLGAARARERRALLLVRVERVPRRRGPRHGGRIGLVDPATGTGLPVEAVSGEILSEHGEVQRRS